MKYVKGFDYQVIVKYRNVEIASMYFQRLEDAENHYNSMIRCIRMEENTEISLNNYVLQLTSEKGYSFD